MKHQHRLFVLGIISALSFGIFSLFALEGTRAKTLKAANYTGTYYSSINWDQTGATLKSALSTLINPHTNVGYDGLWDVYKTSDVDSNGKIWDVYSNYRFTIGSGQCGTYSVEGDCYNREHTIPQSIFSKAAPMVSDAHHIYPTDGKVNGMRSNYPHGKVASASYTSGNGSKLGSSDSSTGYTGTVFEPIDEYKGDFARTYFYFVTCYQANIPSYSYASFSQNTYPSLSTWAKNLYLQWAAADPVSQKEIDRNEAIYQVQKNRNPFIDFPAAANAIWGDLTPVSQSSSQTSGGATTSTATSLPSSTTTTPSSSTSTPVSSTPTISSSPAPSPVANTFNLIKTTSELVDGRRYLIGAPSGSQVKVAGALSGTYLSVVTAQNSTSTQVTLESTFQVFTLSKSGTYYKFYGSLGKNYLISTAAKSVSFGANTANTSNWAININSTSGDATLTNYTTTNGQLQYNASSPRFTTYTSSQTLLRLFAEDTAASDYAASFVSSLAGICASSSSGSAPTNSLLSAWQSQSTSYSALSSSNKALVAGANADVSGNSLEQCVAKYDYILKKYGVASFSAYGGNFLSRSVASSGLVLLPEKKGNDTFLYVLAGLSLVLTSSFFFLKKKKSGAQSF